MRALDSLLQSLGQLLLRWGAAFSRAGQADEEADLATPLDDPAAEARAIWQARVAGVPPGAWQGPQEAAADTRVVEAPPPRWPATSAASASAEWPLHPSASPPREIHAARPARVASAAPRFEAPRSEAPRMRASAGHITPQVVDAPPRYDDLAAEATERPPSLKADAVPLARPRRWREWATALSALWPRREHAPVHEQRIVRTVAPGRATAPMALGARSPQASHAHQPIARTGPGTATALQPSLPPWRWRWALHMRPPVTPAALLARQGAIPNSTPALPPRESGMALARRQMPWPSTHVAPAAPHAAPASAEAPGRAATALQTLLPQRCAAAAREAAFESLPDQALVHPWPELPAWPPTEPTLAFIDADAAARAQRLAAEQRG